VGNSALGKTGLTFLFCAVRLVPQRCVRLILLLVSLSGSWLAQAATVGSSPLIAEQSNRQWQNFRTQLRGLTDNTALHVVNILQIGDSHTAGDYFTGRLRELVQQHFGNAGPGFVPPGKVKGHRVSNVKLEPTSHWLASKAFRDVLERPALLGLGGIAGGGQTPWQMIRIVAQEPVKAGSMIVYERRRTDDHSTFGVHNEQEQVFAHSRSVIRSDEAHGYVRHELKLKPSGPTITIAMGRPVQDQALLGIFWLSGEKGVTVSAIGNVGARFGVQENWDTTIVRAQLRDINPALVILAFGTNDAFSSEFSAANLHLRLRSTAQWLAALAPDAAVLAILPPDALIKTDSCSALRAAPRPKSIKPNRTRLECLDAAQVDSSCGMRSQPNLPAVRKEILRAADESGWRTWDWSALMGSQCGAHTWNDDGEPLYRADKIHLTPKGYGLSAEGLFRAIVADLK
jgi:lysophospholipase L1-like esterase